MRDASSGLISCHRQNRFANPYGFPTGSGPRTVMSCSAEGWINCGAGAECNRGASMPQRTAQAISGKENHQESVCIDFFTAVSGGPSHPAWFIHRGW